MNELISVVGNCKKGNPDNLYTPLLRKIIKRYENKKSENLDIYTSLFMSILDEGEGIAIRILLKMNIDLDEIYIDLKEKEKIKQMQISNQIGTFLNKTVNLDEEVYARDEEINKIILSLSRKKKCNPIFQSFSDLHTKQPPKPEQSQTTYTEYDTPHFLRLS